MVFVMVLLLRRKKGSSKANLAQATRHLQMRKALKATDIYSEDTGCEMVGALKRPSDKP
jgi:hypothetical protein